jgi:dTDP-4-dehydrorhamnose reductase
MLALEKGEKIYAGTDLYGSPTLIDDVALGIVRAAEKERSGIYHISGPDMLSRFDFATRIAKVFSLDASLIVPLPYSELQKTVGMVAERPLKSALVSLKAQTDLGLHISNVEEGLQVMVRGLQELQGPTEQFLYE